MSFSGCIIEITSQIYRVFLEKKKVKSCREKGTVADYESSCKEWENKEA